MKKSFLLIVTLFALVLSAGAQEKVRQFYRVSDPTFNLKVWDNDENPNEANAVENSFTIHGMFCAVGWDFGGPFWEPGVDMSKYDKLVIRLKSVDGNNLTFNIRDYASFNGLGEEAQYTLPDDIVEMDEEVEYEIDFRDGLDRNNGDGQLDLSNIKQFKFWNYWDVNGDKTDPENEHYIEGYVDPAPGPDVTVTISAMYLERTLENGEKDYLDLLATNTLQFTDEFMNDEVPGSASYIDNTGTLHMNENAEAGLFFDDMPADWSSYKYLVVVPQLPASESTPYIRYLLTDADDNVFDSGTLRHGWWNRARAAVQDLTTITETEMDEHALLESFDPSKIASLKWSLWGGVSTWEYGIAGAWLTNTAPTYSTGIGDGTDQTGDYIIENASENNVMTICLPFAAALCGAQVYDIAGIDDPAEPAELYAKPHFGILEAGKPYIIRTNSSRNVTAHRAGANEVSQPDANGALVADEFVTYYVAADKNYLVLNADGDTFEAVTGRSKRVNSNTAYIDCSKLAVAEEQENGLVFAVSGAQPFEPNAIKTINQSPRVYDNIIYDLSGRRITMPAKGIYVKNGKKFVVK